MRFGVVIVVCLALGPALALEDFRQPFAPDANTRGLWHFDETAGATNAPDASANLNHGAFATGFDDELGPVASWAAGQDGFSNCLHAFWIDSANYNRGAVLVDQGPGHSSLAFSPGTDMTIEFWMRPADSGAGSGRYIVQKYTGGDYAVTYNYGRLRYSWYSGGGWRSVQDTTPLPQDVWTHVAVTVDRQSDPANDTITFYLNGALSSAHVTPYKGGNWNVEPLWMMLPFTGHPAYQFYGKLDEVRISDVVREYGDPVFPAVSFDVPGYDAAEHAGTVQLKLRLSKTWTNDVEVPCTVSGSAVAGLDYTGVSATDWITIPAGADSGSLDLALIDRTGEQGPRTVVVELAAPSNASLGTLTTHTLTIADSFTVTPAVIVTAPYVKWAECDGIGSVDVCLSQATRRTVSVPFTLDGGAVAGQDYAVLTPSPVVFAPNQTRQAVRFALTDDAVAEPDKTLRVTLGSPSNAVPSRMMTARIALSDDDGTAAPGDWQDAFYPFRRPIAVNVPAPGEVTLDISPEDITAWLNADATFAFDAGYFNYGGVKLVQIDANGGVIDDRVDAAFVLRPAAELLTNGNFESHQGGQPDGWTIVSTNFVLKRSSYDGSWDMNVVGSNRYYCGQNLAAETNTWYRFSCWKEGSASVAPMISSITLGSVQPVPHDYADTYIPSQGWRRVVYPFYVDDKHDWNGDSLYVRMEQSTGAADDISVRKCEVALVLDAPSAGQKRYMLYYAPMEGTTSRAPTHERTDAMPAAVVSVTPDGPGEWLTDITAYTVATNPAADLWFAAPTVKVLPHAAAPARQGDRIRLSCARNESEALQLVLDPRASGTITAVDVTLNGPGGTPFSADRFDIRHALYVPIHDYSRTGLHYKFPSRSRFTGALPDPLRQFEETAFAADGTNVLIWVDITVPASESPGTATGAVTVVTSAGTLSTPLELTVRDFVLPSRPTCRSALQISRYANVYLFPWHKVTTQQDKYDLSRAYVAALARYRLSATAPHNAWSHYPGTLPPGPCGAYLVEMPWALDEQHVTGFSVGHYSGNHLADTTPAEADAMAATHEPRAECLAAAGLQPWSYIQIDEPQPHAYKGVRTWIEGFRNYPNARNIPMFGFVYHGQAWDGLRDHLDIVVPIDNDFGSALSPVGAAIAPPGQEVWAYWTCSSHQWIDAPGIGNRLWAPKVKAFGAMGLSTWGVLKWWSEQGETYCDNPWVDPGTSWGNGVLAYFYPPHPAGPDLPARDMTVVPSLRLVLTREGLEDFEYAKILQSLVEQAESVGIDATPAVRALAGFRRPFISPQSWTVGLQYWLATRAEMAEAIEELALRVASDSGATLRVR